MFCTVHRTTPLCAGQAGARFVSITHPDSEPTQTRAPEWGLSLFLPGDLGISAETPRWGLGRNGGTTVKHWGIGGLAFR